MTNKAQDKLHALLKAYAERTAPTPAAAPPAHDEQERRRRVCGDRLQKVVRTVLERTRDELKSAGHEASIEDQSDTVGGYPSLELTFRPRAPGGGALASVLAFRCDPRRGIAVGRDIKPLPAKGRVVTTSSDRIGTMKMEAVTVEWVETKTLSFIEAVLKVN